jgi:adenylate kinase
MKVIVFLGPPGAGKGTHTFLATQTFHAPVLGMGDILRDEIARGTDIGKKVQSIMQSGAILESKCVIDLLREKLKGISSEVVFLDGVPRSVEQAVEVEKLLKECFGAEVVGVIFLNVSSDTVLKRIRERCLCAKCEKVFCGKRDVCDECGSKDFRRRSDDEEGIVLRRLEVYQAGIEPLLRFYEDREKLVVVNAEAKREAVQRVIVNEINRFLATEVPVCRLEI